MRTWHVDDVMTTEVVTVAPTASYRELVDLLVDHRFSAVPVVDDLRRVIGVVSEADLLRKIEYAAAGQPPLFEGRRRRGERVKASARTAAELMSSPPVLALVGTPLVVAARRMDTAGVKRLPVVDDLGRPVGIVSRGDLLKVHQRPDDEILADVRSGVLLPFLIEDAETVHVEVAGGVVTLTGRVGRWSARDIADRMTQQVPGVVDVVDKLEFDHDDREVLGAGVAFGMV
jgi:CBS domain-containing protein